MAASDNKWWGSGWEWPRWGDDPESATLRERLGRLVGTAPWLLFLISPITEVTSSARPTSVKVTVVLLTVMYGGCYLWIGGTGNRFSHRNRALGIALLGLFPIGLSFFLGPIGLLYSTYAVSPALMMLPRNIGAAYGLGVTAALLIATRLHDGKADWSSAMILAVLTVAMAMFGALLQTISTLKRTQDQMAKLAVAEERSRLARDLHDVLGHSLTTITVKAGLARRILETSADPDRAAAEVRDVEKLARQAMTEVRATVSGYRTASLPAELVGARAALGAAGIVADLPVAVDNVPAGLREMFGYVVREGVTNVIRHSGASRCEIRLGDNWLEVRDNGNAGMANVTDSRQPGGGHGLSGLAERVSQFGGELDAGPLPEGGFLLQVQVPHPPKQAQKPVPEAAAAVAPQPSVELA